MVTVPSTGASCPHGHPWLSPTPHTTNNVLSSPVEHVTAGHVCVYLRNLKCQRTLATKQRPPATLRISSPTGRAGAGQGHRRTPTSPPIVTRVLGRGKHIAEVHGPAGFCRCGPAADPDAGRGAATAQQPQRQGASDGEDAVAGSLHARFRQAPGVVERVVPVLRRRGANANWFETGERTRQTDRLKPE